MIKVRPEFPIVRDIIENGQHFIRMMDENEKVKCRMCNNPILIDARTVHVAEDGMQMVDCPSCKSHVSILYYFDQVDKRIRKPVKVKYHRGQRLKEGGL